MRCGRTCGAVDGNESNGHVLCSFILFFLAQAAKIPRLAANTQVQHTTTITTTQLAVKPMSAQTAPSPPQQHGSPTVFMVPTNLVQVVASTFHFNVLSNQRCLATRMAKHGGMSNERKAEQQDKGDDNKAGK